MVMFHVFVVSLALFPLNSTPKRSFDSYQKTFNVSLFNWLKHLWLKCLFNHNYLFKKTVRLENTSRMFNMLFFVHFMWSMFFMPPPFEEWWRGIKCYPVCVCVRPSEIWCPLNKFWKTASIQFKFGMLIYTIKTQVKFDLGYNPLIFDRVMGLVKKT